MKTRCLQNRRLSLSRAALAFLFGLVSLAPLARADDAPVITARLKCLSMGGPSSDVDLLQSGGTRLHLKMTSSCISLPSTYHGPATLVFVRPVSAPPANDSANSMPSVAGAAPAKPVVLAVITLPPAGGDYLILFSGTPSAPDGLQVAAVPFSPADVPAGTSLVWNITSRSLGLVFGDCRVLMNPGQRRLVKPVTRVNNYCDLKIFDEHEGKVRPLISGPHFLTETSRQLLFIVERAPGQAAVMVRTLEELPEPPAPPARRVVANY